MHAMMSDRTSRPSRSEYLPCEPQSGESVALAEARRILNVTEADGVHHDILPGLLRYDLQPMRDLCDALSAFLSAPDPADYLAAVSR